MDLGENFTINVEEDTDKMTFSNSGTELLNFTTSKSTFSLPLQIPRIDAPPTVDPNSVLLYADSNGDALFTNNSGTTIVSKFGSEFQSEELTSQLSTTTNVYIIRQQMVTPSIPAGLYRIEFLLLWRCSAANVTCGAQVFADTNQLFGNENFVQEAKDANARQRSVFTGSDLYNFSGGSLTITIRFNMDKGTGTAFTEYSRITIWRVN